MSVSLASPAFIERLVAYLDANGHDVTRILAEVGIDASTLADPSTLVPLETAVGAYAAAHEAVQTPTLGLDVAVGAGFRSYGVSGFIIANHETVESGLAEIASVASSLLPDFPISITRADGEVRLTVTCDQPWPGHRQAIEEVLASVYRRPLEITEGQWAPKAVYLTGDEVAPERYAEVFRCPVHFDADVDQVVFDAADLQRTIPGANPTLLTHLREAARAQVTRRREAAGSMRRTIRLEGCDVDLTRGEVVRADGVMHLTTKERAILTYLADRPNATVSHDALESEVWGMGAQVISHAPAVAVRRLRQKIEPNPRKPVNLVTVFGEGWKLVVPEAA